MINLLGAEIIDILLFSELTSRHCFLLNWRFYLFGDSLRGYRLLLTGKRFLTWDGRTFKRRRSHVRRSLALNCTYYGLFLGKRFAIAVFQSISALYLGLFDNLTFSYLLHLITWPWLCFCFLTVHIRFLFYPYWGRLPNTCLFLQVALRYFRMISLTKLYQKLARPLYLLCSIITPIFVIEPINVLNSLV